MAVDGFSLPVRVYYEDTDAGGVVYYANYLKYFERGRTEFLRSFGFEQDRLIAEQDIIFAVTSIQADYKMPARFNDLLEVVTRISQMKRVSMGFEQVVRRGEETLCIFTAQVACLQASTLKPRAIPEAITHKVGSL